MKKILLTMVLLAAGTAASFASANKLSKPETEAEALLKVLQGKCC